MAPLNNMTLVKIASIGGILTVSMGFAWRFRINKDIAATDTYKEAMKIIRHHEAAVHLLGEPIKDLLIDVSDVKRNYTQDYSAHYEVPIKGPKQRGIMHYWAERKTLDDQYNLTRVELQLRDEPDRRLLIKGTV